MESKTEVKGISKEDVIENLKAFGLDTELTPQIFKYLIKISDDLEDVRDKQNKAIDDIQLDKITIAKLTQLYKLPRQYFYKFPILAEYFEAYKAQCLVENPFTTIENLKEKIRRKDEQIENFIQRDASIAIYKERIRVLEEELEKVKKNDE